MAHLSAAHEISNEFKAFAIPGVEIRTRRRLSFKFGNVQRRKRALSSHSDRSFGLDNTGRPQHAHSVCGGSLAQSENHVRRSGCGGGGRSFKVLDHASRASFDLGTDTTA